MKLLHNPHLVQLADLSPAMEQLVSSLLAQRNDFLNWYQDVSILTEA